MRTRTHTLLVVAALLGIAAVPARGQHATIDPRWLAYLGCWERVDAAKFQVCVVPAAGTSAVDLLTIAKGEVTARERITATGEHVQSAGEDCTGWKSAEWSAQGQRLYLHSEGSCAGGVERRGAGLIAMSGDGQWLYIQGATIGGQTGLRVQRYREATSELLLPNDVADAIRLGVAATIEARAAAAAPLSVDDVVEASQKVDVPVLEAWLVARAEQFSLNAKRLVALADAGVPSRVIDLMVALSYPRAFAINPTSRQGERLARRSDGVGTTPASYATPYDPLCAGYSFMYPYTYFTTSYGYFTSPYGSYDCSGLGYSHGYGYGLYPGGSPVTIIYVGSGGGRRPHGQVSPDGYIKGTDEPSAQALPRPSDSWSQPSGGSSSGSTGTRTSTPASGSTEQRTAKPRPPQ
jgi:hypothetical protein